MYDAKTRCFHNKEQISYSLLRKSPNLKTRYSKTAIYSDKQKNIGHPYIQKII